MGPHRSPAGVLSNNTQMWKGWEFNGFSQLLLWPLIKRVLSFLCNHCINVYSMFNPLFYLLNQASCFWHAIYTTGHGG